MPTEILNALIAGAVVVIGAAVSAIAAYMAYKKTQWQDMQIQIEKRRMLEESIARGVANAEANLPKNADVVAVAASASEYVKTHAPKKDLVDLKIDPQTLPEAIEARIHLEEKKEKSS